MKGPIKFIHHKEVDSTHSWLEKNYCEIEESHPNGLAVISADNQTGGRGTGNRQWVCPPGKGVRVTITVIIPGL
jgi:biotin-(acetyl-CoA carboxylase) ligase